MIDQGSSIRVDGAVLYTCMTEWTDQKKLYDGLAEAGFEKFAPEARTPLAAIGDAMKAVFKDDGFRIERLSQKQSWEIREVKRGENENEYVLRHLVHLRDDEFGNPKILVGPYDHVLAYNLVATFNQFLGLVRSSQVTMAMTRCLKTLAGTTLRPQGSVYWVPGTNVERWKKVCEAVEAAGTGPGNHCYLIRHVLDGDALKAVRDAIVAEITSEVARIEADVQSGELGERALTHRKEEATALRDRLRVYEETLHVGMGDMHALLDHAEQTAMSAALLVSIGAGAA